MATKAVARRIGGGGEQSPQSTTDRNPCWPRRSSPFDTILALVGERGAKTSTRPRIRQLSPRGSRPRCEEGRKIKEGRREGVADRKLRSWQQWEESPSTRGRQGGQIFTPARVAKLEGNRFEMTFHLTGHKRWRRVQGRKTRSHPLRGQCAPTISIQRKRETWLRG